MAKVTIINTTKDAAELLLFTKNTRLNMSPDAMADIMAWPSNKKQEELAKMSTTIRSSWEFCQVTFLIEGVTRAGAQQITRSRNASYAMQSQRVVDARGIEVVNPFPKPSANHKSFSDAADKATAAYAQLVDFGAKLEDARGLLPMNTACNLVAQYNLRALSDLIKARKSLRAQGEYNDIALHMERATKQVWPWVGPFFASDHDTAIGMLEKTAKEIGIKTGSGPGWNIAKAVDLLRKGAQ